MPVSIVVAAGYLVATIWMTWPLTARAGTAVQDVGDPLLEIWIMRSVQHGLVTDPLDLYHANAFYPFQYSLAYSEEAISTALFAWPVYLLTGNDILAYNWVVLSTFWLAGFAVYLLATELGAARGAAFIGGLIAAFFAGRYAHLSHLHLLVIGWLPLALWALTRFHRTRQSRYAIAASVALSIQLLASLHMAVFSSLALILYVPFLLAFDRDRARSLDRSTGLSYIAMLAVPYLILFPTLIPHLRAGDLYGFGRTRDEVERFSATLSDYGSVFITNQFLSRWLPSQPEAFFPGFVALVGMLLLAFNRRWTWQIWSLAALTLTAMLLSFGFSLGLAGQTVPMPYELVYSLAPPMRNIRGVGRFGMLAGIGFALLGAFGFTAGWRRIRPACGPHARTAGILLTVVLSVLVSIELRSDIGTEDAPADPDRLELYAWLASQPAGAVIEFPTDRPLRSPFQTIEYMYYSTRHWQPIVSGYSGYVPKAHLEIQQQFASTPDRPSMVTGNTVGLLQDLGVRYVVIHRQPGYDWQTAVAVAEQLPELKGVAEVGGSFVYVLRPGARLPVELRWDLASIRLEPGERATLPLVLDNRNTTTTVVALEDSSQLRVDLRWDDSGGNAAKHERGALSIPHLVGPGSTVVPLLVTAPNDMGAYALHVTVSGPLTAQLVAQLDVRSRAHSSDTETSAAKVAIAAVTWDTSQFQPGRVGVVKVIWYVLDALPGDFTGTVQLFDEADNTASQVDIELRSDAGTTRHWKPGSLVETEFPLTISGDLQPGDDYRLLIAMYDASKPEYPRAPLLLSDASVATEMWIQEVHIGPP